MHPIVPSTNPVKSLRTLATASLIAASLSACYVIPIDGHNYQQQAQGPGNAPAVVIPAPQPQPVVMQARLYPANDVAGKMGVLTATVTDNLNGRGTFALVNGAELMQGEATRVSSDYPGFGNIHRQVFGEGRMLNSGRRGIANAAGQRGSYMNCEYVLTSSAMGTGACLFSNGAKYQIHFGS